MAALTSDRNTPKSLGERRALLVAAGAKLFVGALACRNATGFATPGATALGLVGVGCAMQHVDNTAGADGAAKVQIEPGFFRFANSAGPDEITAADIGKLCFVVDDQTVAKTNGTATRSPAGLVDQVDDLGVWVRFDEALTLTAAAAAA